jgi:hypothetical protein
MKSRVSKLFRTEVRCGGFLLLVLLVASVLFLAIFVPALSQAADIAESKPPDVAKPASQAKADAQMAPSPAQNDARRLDEKKQPKQRPAPLRDPASYPTAGQGSQGAIRSIKRAESDFAHSMRNLNDSLRRANDAINRIRSLNRRF